MTPTTDLSAFPPAVRRAIGIVTLLDQAHIPHAWKVLEHRIGKCPGCGSSERPPVACIVSASQVLETAVVISICHECGQSREALETASKAGLTWLAELNDQQRKSQDMSASIATLREVMSARGIQVEPTYFEVGDDGTVTPMGKGAKA